MKLVTRMSTVAAFTAALIGLLFQEGGRADTAGTALNFNGTNQYVTFGAAPGLGAATFTLETWFKRTGTGVGTSTAGSGGLSNAVPLVTKGRGEADGSNVDMNYFLGIDASSGKLVADFEEGLGTGGTLGLNHPISGNTVITSNAWHHAAATYDGQTWNLYLDGTLDGTLTLTAPRPPRSDSIQHAALATAMNSTGVAAGFFAGVLDETRIWNVARTQAQIQATRYSEIAGATANLIGRWGMNEGLGTVVTNSAGSINGTTTNGPTWVPGFPVPDTIPPAAPQNLTATAGNTFVVLDWNGNAETDLAGYNIYRSLGGVPSGGPLNGGTLITGTTFTDTGLTNLTTYYYVIEAVDSSANASSPSNEASAMPDPASGAALSFDGTNDYVTFGAAPGLATPTFTLETWFKRIGAGVGTSTGNGGIASAVPLVTKGRAEAEGSSVDMNYFLGIDATSGKLVADFEDMASGGNHPIAGSTSITNSVWHHAAATYNGSKWQLFLDGVLEAELVVNQTPRADSIQHAGLATAMDSTGLAAGFFNGLMDESRIWNYARTQAQIQGTKNLEITSAVGLVGRWSMNEGSGTLVADSSGFGINGMATNGPAWVAGYPFGANSNQPPIANAGSDQTITLPAEASLIGTVTDDGLPNPPAATTSVWSKFSGPGTVTFVNPNATSTSASFSTSGTYVLRLTASDSLLQTSDDVTIVVNPAPVNQGPVVNAGPDQTITLPAEASLTGTVTDDGLPGPAVTSSWSKFSGPGTVTFANANATSTTASFSVAGSYVLRLTASDGALSASDEVAITVNPVPGNYGTDFGGTDAYVTFGAAPGLGLSTFTIETRFRRDGAGVATNTGSGGIGDGIPLVTKGRAEAEGSSVDMNFFLGIQASTNKLVADFEDTATGANHPVVGATSITNNVWHHAAATYDGSKWQLFLDGALEAELIVNQTPRADSIQHAALATAMNSTGIAAGFFDGVIDEARIWDHARTQAEIRADVNQELSSGTGLVARWGLNEGIGTVVGDSTDSPVNGSIVGSNWSWGAGASPINLAPVVNAGPDQNITLPANASLSGNVIDDGLPNPPGSPTSAWSKFSGPGTVMFGNPNATSTTASFSTSGTYVLRLTASDSLLQASDDVTITVAPGNQAPVVNAGPDQSVTLPAESSLTGTVTDDGLPNPPAATTNVWSKVSGPGTVTFANPNAPSTTASFSTSGTYVLRLTADDSLLQASDELTVTVNPVPVNQAPVVNAGPDQAVVIPSAATLAGTATDDGLPGPPTLTVAWSRFSGPGTVTFANASAANTTATFSGPGVYTLRLTANDGVLASSDDVLVTATAAGNNALAFSGSSNYVTFGAAPGLGASTFTLEAWFKRTGAGVGTNTGTFGIPDVIPLVSKGRAEADGSNLDMNYILGIKASNGVLAADFEDTATGLNHPVLGVTPIAVSATAWHHAAVTYNGSAWKLYLDGVLETSLDVGSFTPRFDSIQHAGLGTALTSGGVAAGFFAGVIDEARIWNYARSSSQIAGGRDRSIATASGLLGRWGLDDACATTVLDSTGHGNSGTVAGTLSCVAGAPPLPGNVNLAPAPNAGPDQEIILPASAALAGAVTDDGVAGPVVTTWATVSGPGTVSFGDANALSTSSTFSAAGTYVLRLAADDAELTGTDTVTITVDRAPPVNQAPVVNAGSDQTISLPANASLSGTVTDDGLPGPSVTSTWSKFSGPGTVTFLDASTASTTASFSVAGSYVLRLTANDGALSSSDDVAITVNPAAGNYAVDFGGTNAYVTFGAAPTLGLPTFTIETKFRRDGAGVAAYTGTNGVTAVPLITKGMAEIDGSNLDMNYFLGIDFSSNRLVADFEDMATGLNHPVAGATSITNDVWHHAAATYDGSKWQLFLDGVLEAELVVNQTPRSDSIQHAALGSALQSNGLPANVQGTGPGFFDGVMDEARIWDHARTQAEIRADLNQELPSGTGLVARWGLNEGIGTSIADSTDSPVNGSIIGSNWSWVAGAPSINLAPVVNAGPDQSITLPANATLAGTVADDGLPGSGVISTWSTFSGPGTVTFGNPNATSTTASFSTSGTYVLRLTANDTLLQTSDDVTVTVNPAPVNQAPVVNAGPDQTITLPAGASLTGTVTDDGLPGPSVTSSWTKFSGPGTVTFGDASAASTTASFSVAGSYVLRLTANDGALSSSDDVAITVNPAAGNYAVDFGGTDAYVTFGAAPILGLPTFTIETKFRRDGAGVSTSTGTGGVTAVPLVTKGRAEQENGPVDMNYFLGIDSSTNKIAADFEEANTGLAGNTPGLNHPVVGVTTIENNVWYHVAATYDGITWRLYLNGALEAQLSVGQPPRSDSIQHAGIATAMNSTGIAAGFFDGVIDEARIWDHARSQAEIRADLNQELSSGTGLVARWGLNEGAGTIVGDSSVSPINGSIIGSNWSWVAGAPAVNLAPAVDAGPDQNIEMPASATLSGVVSDDGLPNPPGTTTITWSKVSGPGTVTFANPNTASTTASFSTTGPYVLGLTANDGALSSSDQLTVTVTGNQAPVVSAGPDQTITLPAGALLNGSVTDDGLPIPPTLTAGWTRISGPGVVTFGEPTSPTTPATFSVAGVYVLRLTAGDGSLTSYDETTITVNPTGSPSNQAIDFGGTNAYVTFGNPAKLHLPAFTVETWFNRQGSGVTATTGTGGIVNALPLVTRGTGESETAAVDMNYFLGIDAATNVLAADFEEGAGGTTPSANHPIRGVTTITNNTWHHAAATYDGNKWQLFLDGVLEGELTVGQPVAAAGNQYAAIGSALTSGGVAASFFDGVIDEARIWNRALTASEIQANMSIEITGATGLVARWGLNEGTGTSVGDSTTAPAVGTVTGTNWAWAAGAPFIVNHAPNAPVLIAPASGGTGVGTSPSLDVSVLDLDGGNLTVTYYGRPKSGSPSSGPDFTLIALPDTQFYVSSLNGGTPAIFNAQTQWIVDNMAARNIAFVTQLGDCVQNGDNGGNAVEWINADTAMSKLEVPPLTAWGIPFGIAVGNHDQSPIGSATGTTTFYNQYFGESRFNGRAYYGGHYGTNNDNHYELFSVSGLDFIIVHLEYDTSANPEVLSWANGLLQTYSDRRAIIVSHYILNAGNPATFGAQGQAIYTALKGNPNLFLMLSGHVSPPEGQRQDTFNGHTVTSLMSDYQGRAHGGDGWLRIMEFSPANNQIRVKTYSPTLNQFETDADSQFTIDYDMEGGAVPFTMIGANGNVASGTSTSTTWSDLSTNTEYEWYATVSDGQTTTTGPTWTFTTAGAAPNQAPVAAAQAVTTLEDTARAITLLASDPDGDPLTFSIVTGPAHGVLSGTAPNVTYTPAVNYNGSDSFTFKARDGSLDSNVATVTITVTPVNDAPVANGQPVTTPEDTAKAITLTASDPDGDSLSFSIVTQPTHGTLTGAAPNLIYTPGAGYNGSDSFTFKANDGTTDSNIATVNLTITGVNQAPTANSQAVTTAEDIASPITLSASDPDGDPLIFSIVTGPAHGALSGTAPNVAYTPAVNYNGSDSFTFKARDGSLDSNVATVTITVTPVNDAPVANGQALTTPEDTAKAITLTASDPDGDSLSFSIVTQPTHGALSGTAPNLTYTPAAGYNGSDSFTFKANDGTTDSNIATVSITVSPVNDPPSADDQTVTTAEDTAKSITLLASDPDGDPLTFSIVAGPTHGSLSGTAPNVTYTPAANYNGSDSFTFKARDGSLDSNVASVSITVSPVNDAPAANAQVVTTPEATATPITLTGSDPDGDPLTFSVVTGPVHGVLSGTGSNQTYTPAAGYNGSDSFTFKVNDGTVDSSVATVTITVSPVNDPPIANGQSVTTPEDTATPITLTGSDPDGDPLTFSVVIGPIHGSLSGTAPNVTYIPAANYNGSDAFTFKARDGSLDSNVATVSITVAPVNDAPVAANGTFSTPRNRSLTGTLTASDVDSTTLTYSIVATPRKGTVLITDSVTGSFTYTPNANANGSDSFTFKANDGSLDSNIATVSIKLNAATGNTAPTASNGELTTPEDTAGPITLTGSDPDSDPLTFSIVTGPAHGVLSGTAPNVTYTPAANYNGSDSFTFKANDGTADSNVATVSITVSPVNDAPIANGQDVTTPEDTAKAITLTGSDPDGDSLTFSIVDQPTHGTLNGAPNAIYTPVAGYIGLDSFTFKVNDGTADSNIATVNLTITGVNQAPTANAQAVTTAEDAATAITLTGSDPERNPLTFSIVTPPSNGMLTGTAPNVTYTPAANYNGPDSFTFKANDGTADSDPATISITVDPVNDAPVATSTTFAVPRNRSFVGQLTATDVDSPSLTYSIEVQPTKGTVATSSEGVFTYTPNTGATGWDSFTFKASDGALYSNIATATIKLSKK